jgi:hypothetical protein
MTAGQPEKWGSIPEERRSASVLSLSRHTLDPIQFPTHWPRSANHHNTKFSLCVCVCVGVCVFVCMCLPILSEHQSCFRNIILAI